MNFAKLDAEFFLSFYGRPSRDIQHNLKKNEKNIITPNLKRVRLDASCVAAFFFSLFKIGVRLREKLFIFCTPLHASTGCTGIRW